MNLIHGIYTYFLVVYLYTGKSDNISPRGQNPRKEVANINSANGDGQTGYLKHAR